MSLPPLNESRREEKWRSHKTLKRDSIDKELEDIAAELAKGRIKLGEQNKECRKKMDEKLTTRENSPSDDLLVDSDKEEEVYDRN